MNASNRRTLRHATWVIALSSAWAVACGGTAPAPSTPAPADDPPSASSPSTAPDDVDAPSAPEAPAAPAVPHAKVHDIKPAKDDPADRRAHIEFFNPTDRACSFTFYTLKWGSSSKRMPLDNFSIDPGQSRQRYLLLHPIDGDLDALTVDSATIELETSCGQ